MFVALVLKGLFLITHTTSHFPHCDAFVISSEYTPNNQRHKHLAVRYKQPTFRLFKHSC